jgi:hypothetical protein
MSWPTALTSPVAEPVECRLLNTYSSGSVSGLMNSLAEVS